jgi:hypothetical protein
MFGRVRVLEMGKQMHADAQAQAVCGLSWDRKRGTIRPLYEWYWGYAIGGA